MSELIGKTVEQLKEGLNHINRLCDRIDPSDLGELAQIHEHALHCQEAIKGLTLPGAEVLGAFCLKVAETVESIILESCPNPRQALELLGQAMGRIGVALETEGTFPGPEIFQECLTLMGGGEKANPSTPVQVSPKAESETPSEPATAQPQEAAEKHEYTPLPLMLSESEFEYIKSFLTECHEHIEGIETGLLVLEQTPDDLDKINELFRPFHTIKGMAGFLNLLDVQALTHEMETLLDLGRKGKLKVTPPVIDVIFEGLDVLKAQVGAIGQYMANPTGQAVPQPPIGDLLGRISLAAKGINVPAVLPPATGGSGRKPLGEILNEDAHVSPALVEFALSQQSLENKPVGEILTSMGAATAKDVSQALRKQNGEVQDTVVRVDTQKLDGLVNLAGELVIIQTQVEQNEVVRLSPKFMRLIEQVSKITRDIQEAAMSMRMVPIGQTFHKMGRVLRDLSRKVGKTVQFEIDGEETEMDKNMIQELSDPLMHMIRNAVDHGIEPPDVRTAAGKPAAGTVKLRAYHQAGNIVIEISDDGKGLDKDVLIRKAADRGVIAPDALLTEQQAFQLIMAPGFSTAEKVTDISGRGVGMDVVKRNIDKLRGKIEIHSVKGVGSSFIIRLPLTLAVIDGMIVRVGKQKFVLPTLSVIQSLSPTTEQLETVQGRGRILNLRGQLYPLLSLATMFRLSDALTDWTKAMVVIAQAGDQQIGLVLDELLGQQQVVIKSLGHRFKGVTGISGGAILGDGTIGLILDPPGLLELHHRKMKI